MDEGEKVGISLGIVALVLCGLLVYWVYDIDKAVDDLKDTEEDVEDNEEAISRLQSNYTSLSSLISQLSNSLNSMQATLTTLQQETAVQYGEWVCAEGFDDDDYTMQEIEGGDKNWSFATAADGTTTTGQLDETKNLVKITREDDLEEEALCVKVEVDTENIPSGAEYLIDHVTFWVGDGEGSYAKDENIMVLKPEDDVLELDIVCEFPPNETSGVIVDDGEWAITVKVSPMDGEDEDSTLSLTYYIDTKQ
ncbi:MAG: hypothetical protein DRO11_00025 [Methanobacteriota archaeon]|nr:MAG: hypothetical protein DRO11_00025 [Euryarchaeota archaeon]